ncbi:hypothetical protein ACFU98_00350 [Streptomyces sp. NPDC057575]|uniref:RlpA-like double-psi beta-barrel domain-containing protein n=1 Tax=unclassified Streptomyces TaxID=2593676 RepID=UPI0036ACEEE0
MRAKIAKIAAAALLAVGSAAVVAAAASASEDTDIPVPASSASGQPEPGSTLTESPGSTLAPEPGQTTALPPDQGRTTPPPPDPGQTSTPPADQGKATPPASGRTTGPPAGQPPGDYPPSADHHGDATYYTAGLGACGITTTDSDFAVALDAAMFDSGYPSSFCGKKIVVTHNGKSITATVTDRSEGAGRYGIDLTPSAYEALASLDQRKIDVTWRFVE